MKKLMSLLFVCSSAVAFATNVTFLVEKVNNHQLVTGSTYRVYAVLPEAGQSLHIVWGDTENPITIESTAPFYQNALGHYSSANINSATVAVDPALKYDSFVTVGYSDNQGNDMWDLGMDFTDFEAGGTSILANNGAWFLIPSDPACSPQVNNLVLIAQFTTTGEVNGTVNLQGWDANQEVWQARGVPFSTKNAEVFGCNDNKAQNYNPDATYNDGSCEFGEEIALGVASQPGFSSWEIFPNPLNGDMLHIQFNEGLNPAVRATIQIIDASGKLIAEHLISSANIVGNNRVTINQSLSGGTYKVVLKNGARVETKTLVVAR